MVPKTEVQIDQAPDRDVRDGALVCVVAEEVDLNMVPSVSW